MKWEEFNQIVKDKIDTNKHLAWIDIDFPNPKYNDEDEKFVIKTHETGEGYLCISYGG